MALSYDKVFGIKKKDEGTAQSAVLSLKEEDKADAKAEAEAEAKGDIMPEKSYRSLIDNLVEGFARHLKGETIKVKIDDARAQALIRAGYIEEIVPEAPKVEEKAIEAPIKKVITGEDTDKKDATGFGAKLLKKKGKK